MTRRAVVLGGNGLIGVAATAALARDGWEVTLVHRGSRPLDAELGPFGVREVIGDAHDPDVLRAAVGSGTDVVVDVVAMRAEHARAVQGLDVGSAVVISSAAVYATDDGRPLLGDDHPPPPLPVTEGQRVVEADGETYAGGKVELEEAWLACPVPATLLRAGAIHGPRATNPREWFALKRVLDGRRDVVLAHDGASRFQPVAAANLAELVRLAAANPGDRVLNGGDPSAPTVADIVRRVYGVVGAEVRVHPMAGPAVAGLGASPWGLPWPFVLDMSAAERELGYRAVTSYDDALPGEIDWMREVTASQDWREAFPTFAWVDSQTPQFDYAAEDAWIADQGAPAETPGAER
ncbi:NAD-dependent epimerase/dehydratase [Beutenbergia cavernae DSM 12333]|uniref:NAD-dependent epimerase/dehydratase n=1 Tax=Beutenbergia cavernae (strain ATCC BAA-8 / DSM 12333 / CCUG 43141 / JCM 11478 / NBRC 16432 / NCIMB 13614 / HKI 0122) TaxID=471853 RepID=C5BYY4_BEUC1|nr:NAD-dependent epimerase/dehydratase family protein [Beutenbergia cavernae]ACQ81099.1 NAD-dependent epimerase/dehydratase [Beutenbergia cavernae DSM 12333]